MKTIAVGEERLKIAPTFPAIPILPRVRPLIGEGIWRFIKELEFRHCTGPSYGVGRATGSYLRDDDKNCIITVFGVVIIIIFYTLFAETVTDPRIGRTKCTRTIIYPTKWSNRLVRLPRSLWSRRRMDQNGLLLEFVLVDRLRDFFESRATPSSFAFYSTNAEGAIKPLPSLYGRSIYRPYRFTPGGRRWPLLHTRNVLYVYLRNKK